MPQLRALGVLPAQLRTQVRRGTWRKVGLGAYAVRPAAAGTPAAVAQHVWGALLAKTVRGTAPATFVAAGRTSAALHGLAVVGGAPDRPELIEIGGRGRHHRRAVLRPSEVVEVCGVLAVGPARSAVDVARQLGWVAGLVTIDSALRAGITRDELGVHLGTGSTRGSGAAWMAVHLAPERDTALESLSWGRVREHQIPAPLFRLVHDPIPEQGLRRALVWQREGVVVILHEELPIAREGAIADPLDRVTEVLRWTLSDLFPDASAAVGDLCRALGRAGWICTEPPDRQTAACRDPSRAVRWQIVPRRWRDHELDVEEWDGPDWDRADLGS